MIESLIVCVSLGRSAPLQVRERSAPDPADLLTASHPGIGELMLLATCHRVELYATCEGNEEQALATLSSLLLPEDDRQDLTVLSGRPAVEHLFRVTAGLESLVVGEPQIQAQVRRALYTSRLHGAAGPTLANLVSRALRAGREARRSTALGAIGESLGTATARLLEQRLGSLAGAQGLIVGAGIAAEDAAIAIRSRGASLTITSRNASHAHALAARLDSSIGELKDLPKLLLDAAFLVVAVSGGVLLDELDGADPIVVDLSMPHAVADPLAPVRIDDLPPPTGVHVSTGIAEASELIRGEVDAVWRWHSARTETAAATRALRAFGDRIVQHEVDRAGPDPAAREAARQTAERVAAKLLHGPLSAIRNADARTAAWLADLLAPKDQGPR